MNKITWFYNWEKRLWGDKIEANRYFATISILFSALLGVIFAGGELIAGVANVNLTTPLVIVFALVAVVYSINVAESIMATTTIGSALGRSALLLLCMTAGLVVGVVATVVVALIIGLYIVLFFIGGMLGGSSKKSGSSSSSNTGMYAYDENGSQVNLTDEGGGYARDEYGHLWKNAGGSRWTKDE